MTAFQQIVLAVNLLVALVFGLDCFIIDSPKVKPRTKARLGVLLAGLFLAFLTLLLPLAVLKTLLEQRLLHLTLLAYVMIPFAIGKLCSYRTVKFYSALQMIAFLLCAVTLCVM